MPRRLDVHIIMDNYGTHKTPLIRNWFAKRPLPRALHTRVRVVVHLVERWFALLTTSISGAASSRSVPQLKAAIQAFIDAHHENPKPFVWTKTADEILASIARFAERTADARAIILSRTIGTDTMINVMTLSGVTRRAGVSADSGWWFAESLSIEPFERSRWRLRRTRSINMGVES